MVDGDGRVPISQRATERTALGPSPWPWVAVARKRSMPACRYSSLGSSQVLDGPHDLGSGSRVQGGLDHPDGRLGIGGQQVLLDARRVVPGPPAGNRGLVQRIATRNGTSSGSTGRRRTRGSERGGAGTPAGARRGSWKSIAPSSRGSADEAGAGGWRHRLAPSAASSVRVGGLRPCPGRCRAPPRTPARRRSARPARSRRPDGIGLVGASETRRWRASG